MQCKDLLDKPILEHLESCQGHPQTLHKGHVNSIRGAFPSSTPPKLIKATEFVEETWALEPTPTAHDVELALLNMLNGVKEHDIVGMTGVSTERAAEIYKVYQYVAKKLYGGR